MATVRIRFRHSSLLAAGVAPCQILVIAGNSLRRLRPELLDVATGRLHSRPRSMIENLVLAAAMHRVAMLAYRHAESGQRTYREIAKGNRANQRGEPPVLAWRQEKLSGAAGDHERRLQRLQDILDELVALTDWKKL